MIRAFKRVVPTPVVVDQAPAIRIEWVLERSFAQPGPYSFKVLQLEGPSDQQPRVVSAGGDGHWTYDLQPRLSQVGRMVFYQVILTDAEGREWESPATPLDTSWGGRDWRIARSIVKGAWQALRKRTGTAGWLVKRRYWGTPCPDCVDPITMQVDNPNCGTCYGTAFAEGYHDPVPYWVQVEQANRVSSLRPDDGHVRDSRMALTGLAYPCPEPGDLWIMAGSDRRFRIGDQVQASAIHRGVNLILQMQGVELPISDAVYGIELPTREVIDASPL